MTSQWIALTREMEWRTERQTSTTGAGSGAAARSLIPAHHERRLDLAAEPALFINVDRLDRLANPSPFDDSRRQVARVYHLAVDAP